MTEFAISTSGCPSTPVELTELLVVLPTGESTIVQATLGQEILMEYEAIKLVDTGDGVWELILANPPANALNKRMAFELRHAAAQLSTNPSVGAVVLHGEGKVFFGGGDLVEFSEGGDQTPANLHEMTIDFHGALSRMARMNAPVIGAITGTAGGAGMSLTAAMDLVFAGESAKFTMAYTAAGLTPDGTSTFFLSRVVGLRRATELVLTNRVLSADEAMDWGLINRVVADDAVLDEARALAAKLAQGPTHAFGGAKRLLLDGASASLGEAMEREAMSISTQAVHPEAIEGIDAFLNKRRPNFPS
jgi:2-(1,2-epoxy-1,2-dihydrophenyl)acetyl-CoA isomerase